MNRYYYLVYDSSGYGQGSLIWSVSARLLWQRVAESIESLGCRIERIVVWSEERPHGQPVYVWSNPVSVPVPCYCTTPA